MASYTAMEKKQPEKLPWTSCRRYTLFFTLITQKLVLAIWGLCWQNFLVFLFFFKKPSHRSQFHRGFTSVSPQEALAKSFEIFQERSHGPVQQCIHAPKMQTVAYQQSMQKLRPFWNMFPWLWIGTLVGVWKTGFHDWCLAKNFEVNLGVWKYHLNEQILCEKRFLPSCCWFPEILHHLGCFWNPCK